MFKWIRNNTLNIRRKENWISRNKSINWFINEIGNIIKIFSKKSTSPVENVKRNCNISREIKLFSNFEIENGSYNLIK